MKRYAARSAHARRRPRCRARYLRAAAFSAAFAAAGGAAVYMLFFTGLFEIREVRLHGGGHLPLDSLARSADGFAGANVFTVSLAEIREVLMANPAVGAVTFRRRLPHRLDCFIRERQPVALLSIGEMAEVDAQGVVVPAAAWATEIDLPVITGIERADLDGTGREKIGRALEVLALVGRYGFSPAEQLSEIHVDGEEIVLVWMGSGTVVRVGTEHYEERIRKFRVVYPALIEQGRLPAEIDLRFDRQVVVR